jgi:hypothetical protein
MNTKEKIETYQHTERCPNCGRPNECQIPKGTTISEFLTQLNCFFCGCNIGKLIKKLWK